MADKHAYFYLLTVSEVVCLSVYTVTPINPITDLCSRVLRVYSVTPITLLNHTVIIQYNRRMLTYDESAINRKRVSRYESILFLGRSLTRYLTSEIKISERDVSLSVLRVVKSSHELFFGGRAGVTVKTNRNYVFLSFLFYMYYAFQYT